MEQPLISVIIPVFKVEKYLNRCLESVVNQTYRNLEIILVDDGSPDNCPAMCDAWAEKDSRIKVIHKENAGVAMARNDALDIASGEYIGFVDSDDYIKNTMLEELFNAISEYQADVAVCNYTVTDSFNNSRHLRSVSRADAIKTVATGDYKYGVLWNKLYKRDTIGSTRMPELICSEDLVFNYFTFKDAKAIAETDAELYHYSQIDNSTVHKGFGAGAFQTITSREMILNDCRSTEYEVYALYGYILSCYFVLNGIVRNRKFLERYDECRKRIISNKKSIYQSDVFSFRLKIKTLILSISPGIYNHLLSIID